MKREDLIQLALEYADWAEANIYEVPIMLPDVLLQLIETIRELEKQNKILNSFYQYTRNQLDKERDKKNKYNDTSFNALE